MTSLAAAGAEPLAGSRRAIAVGAVLAAMTLAVLDAGMVNVALPGLSRAFAIPPGSAILVVTAYQAGLVMALLPMGAVGERVGHRRVFTGSVAVFGLASAAAFAAPGLPWLVTARFVQGIAGAGIMALGVALLRLTMSRERLGAAIGWNALTVALASAAAPSVGALILAMGDWRGLFLVNLPLAALTVVAARALPPSPRRDAPLDLVSIGLNALMFAAAVLFAQAAARNLPRAAALIAVSMAAFGLLVRREAPKAAPLFPLDLLRLRAFRLSVAASVLCFTAQSAGLLALPFLLQHRFGMAPLATGLYITAWPLSVAVAAAMAGWLADRAPSAWLCAIGGACLAVGLAGCGLVPAGQNPLALLPAIALAGVGFGLFQTPNNRNMFLAAPAERSGVAGGMQGTARVSGQTAGALLMALMFGQLGVADALPAALVIAAALALAAGAVSLLRRVG